jgi:O-antigen/teichoic acid export membrane protein
MSRPADPGLGTPVATPPPAQATLSGQVSRAMLWNAGWQAAKLLAGFLSAIVVANLLSKEGYGTVARLSALAGTFGLIADFGVERGLAKFLPEIEGRYGRDGVRNTLLIVLAQKLLVVAIIVVGCLIFRAQLFGYWQQDLTGEDLRAILQYRWVFFWALMALVFFGAVYDVFMQTLTAYFKQRASGAIAFVVQIISPLLRLVVVLVGWGVLGFVGVLVTIPLVATALAAWQTTRVRHELAVAPVLDRKDARVPSRLVRYSALSYWQQITEYLYSLDFILLLLPGVGAVASLKFGHSLINQALGALWSPLAGIQIPLFARLQARADDRQLGEAYAILCKFLAAIMIPAAVGLALLAYNLLALLGPKYLDGAGAAQILALCLCLDAAISVPLAILMAYERYRPMLIARTCALIAIPLVIVIVPRYGIVGAALIMGGVRLFCDGVAMAFALRDFPIRYPVRFVARVTAAAGAMALTIAPLAFGPLRVPFLGFDDHGNVLKLPFERLVLYLLGNAILGGVGALVYLGVFRLSGGIDPADRRRIVELRLPLASKILRFL